MGMGGFVKCNHIDQIFLLQGDEISSTTSTTAGESTFVTDQTTYYKGDASTQNFQPSVGNQPTQQPQTLIHL